MKNFIIVKITLIFAISLTGFSPVSEFYRYLPDNTGDCPVDNRKIESNGVYIQYLNSHLMFCSVECLSNFKNEPSEYLGDALHCPVCNEDDAKKSISAFHNEIRYYFCGKRCKKKFENDAEMYLKNYEN